MSEHWHELHEHKEILLFTGGIIAAIAGKKIIESKTVKNAATQGMAQILSIKKDAEECFQDMKEEAEDIVVDAHQDEKKEIYVEEVVED